MATHATEGGHYYTRAGNPAYTIVGKNGKERNTTLRDARTLDLVPSVTTILGVAAKPGLERWKQEQVLMAALTLPRQEGEGEKDWLIRVMDDSRETGIKAAERGTEIHAAVQSHYEKASYDITFAPYVVATEKALMDKFGTWDWVAEKSFASQLGFGGKVDLHSKDVVVDIKTKDFSPGDKVEGYDEHLMQLAAYRAGLNMPAGTRCANLFLSRSVPGHLEFVEWTQEDLARGWEMFVRLMEFWQIKNAHK